MKLSLVPHRRLATSFAVLGGITLLTLSVVGNRPATATHWVNPQTLFSACDSAAPALPTVHLGQTLTLTGGEIRIPHPCRIKLADGADLVLRGTDLSSSNLVIEDSPGPVGSEVDVEGGALSGEGVSGLSIELSNPRSGVRWSDVTVTYPLSVWVRAVGGGVSSSGGFVHVSGSHLVANHPDTQGIMLLASETEGEVSVTGSELQTIPGGLRLAYAGICSTTGTPGLPAQCDPSALLAGANR